VKDLHDWHVEKCESHPYFERVSDEEAAIDPCTSLLLNATEEGKKVSRLGGQKHYAIFRKRLPSELPEPIIYSLDCSASQSSS
jgi:tRNA (guanine-N7-)-methyltransferase